MLFDVIVVAMEAAKPTTLGVVPAPGVNRDNIMKEFPKRQGKKNLFLVVLAILVVLAGVGTGWAMSGGLSASGGLPSVTTQGDETKVDAEISEEDLEGLDEAEGTLVEGGIGGEGTHHLERTGGESQTAYLTSTVIDLQTHVGKKVHVWGETLSAVQASWLMDVIRIKEIN